MSVGDVVNLVGSIDGFNQRMLDDYGQRLFENNINGTVLMSCDLAELKPVLQMAFGDWVLFRSLVESLRYSEQSGEPSDGEVSPQAETFIRPAACGSGKTGTKSTSVAVPTTIPGSATPSSKKATSDMTLASVSNSDAVSAGASRSSPTLKDPPTSGDRDDAKPVSSSSPKDHPPLKRQDSFVNEVLMESETLRGFIQASMLGSDSEGGITDTDDEVQRPITTIPEEQPGFSRNTSDSSIGRSSARQMSIVRRMSIGSGPIDRAFSVGPDQDSGESDSEVERVSRRSSIRQIPATHSSAGMKQDADSAAGTSESRQKKSRSKSMKRAQDSHHSSTKLADKSKSSSKLDRVGSECAVPLMSLYFPMAHDHSTAESQSSSHVSSKRSTTSAAPQVSSSTGSRQSESSAPADDSECPRSFPQPTTSAATPMPSSSCTNHNSASQPTDSAEAATADDVKFFIVDEMDSSPKAIMVEMQSLPLHRVTASISSDSSKHPDPDHIAV